MPQPRTQPSRPDRGMPYKAYLELLSSPNKADVVDGLRALQHYPVQANKCMSKVTELSKSNDKDIAELAAQTIKVTEQQGKAENK